MAEQIKFSTSFFGMNDQKYRTLIHLLSVNWDSIKPTVEDPMKMTWSNRQFDYIMRNACGSRYTENAGKDIWNKMRSQYWHYIIQDVNRVRGSKDMLEGLNNIIAPANRYYYDLYATFCRNLITLRNVSRGNSREYWNTVMDMFQNLVWDIPKNVLELGLPPPNYTSEVHNDFNKSFRRNRTVAMMMFAHYFYGKPYIMPAYIQPHGNMVIPKDLGSRDVQSQDEICEQESNIREQESDIREQESDIYIEQSSLIHFIENELVHGVSGVFEMCRDYSLDHADIVRDVTNEFQSTGLNVIMGVPNTSYNKVRQTNTVTATTAAISTATASTAAFSIHTATTATTATSISVVNIETTTSSATTSTAIKKTKPTVRRVTVLSPSSTFVPMRGKDGQTTWQKSSSKSMYCRAKEPRSTVSIANDKTVEETIAIKQQQHAFVVPNAEMADWKRGGERKCQTAQRAIDEKSSTLGDQYPRKAAAERLKTQAAIAEEFQNRSEHLKKVLREQQKDEAEQLHESAELCEQLVDVTGILATEESPTRRKRPAEAIANSHEKIQVDVSYDLRSWSKPRSLDDITVQQINETRRILACRELQRDGIMREQQRTKPAESTICKETSATTATIEMLQEQVNTAIVLLSRRNLHRKAIAKQHPISPAVDLLSQKESDRGKIERKKQSDTAVHLSPRKERHFREVTNEQELGSADASRTCRERHIEEVAKEQQLNKAAASRACEKQHLEEIAKGHQFGSAAVSRACGERPFEQVAEEQQLDLAGASQACGERWLDEVSEDQQFNSAGVLQARGERHSEEAAKEQQLGSAAASQACEERHLEEVTEQQLGAAAASRACGERHLENVTEEQQLDSAGTSWACGEQRLEEATTDQQFDSAGVSRSCGERSHEPLVRLQQAHQEVGREQRSGTDGGQSTWDKSLPSTQTRAGQEPQVTTVAPLPSSSYLRTTNVSRQQQKVSHLPYYQGQYPQYAEGNQCATIAEVSPAFLEPQPRIGIEPQQQYPSVIAGHLPTWSERYLMNILGLHVGGDQRLVATEISPTLLNSYSRVGLAPLKEHPSTIAEQLPTWRECYPMSLPIEQRPATSIPYFQGSYHQNLEASQRVATAEISPTLINPIPRMATGTQQQDPSATAGQLSAWSDVYPMSLSARQWPDVHVPYNQGLHHQDLGGEQLAPTSEVSSTLIRPIPSKTAGTQWQSTTSENVSTWGVPSYERIQNEQCLLPIREEPTSAETGKETNTVKEQQPSSTIVRQSAFATRQLYEEPGYQAVSTYGRPSVSNPRVNEVVEKQENNRSAFYPFQLQK